MRMNSSNTQRKEDGFTLIEMLVATMVMLIDLVSVAQLVPLSIRLNTANRDDSTELVLAQNEMNQFIQQGLTTLSFTDTAGNVCTISGAVGAWAGNPVIPFGTSLVINFGGAPVAGYSFNFSDPNDPTGATYDVRWAVFTLPNGSGRRFIVGARRLSGNAPLLPVNLDSMVTK